MASYIPTSSYGISIFFRTMVLPACLPRKKITFIFLLLSLSIILNSETMLIQNVPIEIMAQILLMLPRATTKQCLLVCKLWYFTAIRIYYSDITLATNNIEEFISTYLTSRQHPSDMQFWARHLRLDLMEYPALPLKTQFPDTYLLLEEPRNNRHSILAR